MFCIHCGTKLPAEALFCFHCGKKVAGANEIQSEQVINTTPSLDELLLKFTLKLGRQYNDVISVAPRLNKVKLNTFLKRTAYDINNEMELVMFDSTVLDYAPGGWLITEKKIYNDSYLKAEPINIIDIVSIELCESYNALICKTNDKISELDFAKTNDLRVYIAEFLESLSGKNIIANNAFERNHFIFDDDKIVIPLNQENNNSLDSRDGTLNAAMLCPHCGKKGYVKTKSTKIKSGISGGKATAALLTGGISLLGTGLSRKQGVTQAHCLNCGTTWHI